ncbi:sensor histidine kinase [Azospirillum sp. ST 5-10]|uniref:sensor histidine kinase n=1 Tax=unclassified Azospirillum TaxID=2630922 RepID=UPI003F4A3BB3
MDLQPQAPTETGNRGADTTLRHLQALAEFGKYALWETDLDALLNEACSQVARGLAVPYTKVLEFRHGERDFLIRAGVGWRPGVVGSVRAPADPDHPPGLAILTRQPVVTEDIVADSRFNPTPLFRAYGVVSVVNVPIVIETDVFGVLEVVTTDRRAFTIHDINFLQGFANLIAAVVHRRRIDQSLKAALNEREVLLRELQHRVKNNLYVVTSLLGLQANRIGDETARRALEEVQGRVHAIGMAYGILQSSQDISRFDLGQYLATLCRTLVATGRDGAQGVGLALDLAPASVSLQVGVPLGLIVNEIVSNSLRHAFPDGRGEITLAVRQQENRVEVRIGDDGRGMGEQRPGSLGLKLIQALTVQIQGTLVRLPTARGVQYQLTFTVADDD